MVTIKTSPAKTLTEALLVKNQKGFTLIEIMVVLGILATVIAIGLPKMRFGNTSLKSVVREISVLTREMRNHARLKSKTYRLAIDLNQKNPRYWVESANSIVFAPSESTVKDEDYKVSSDEKEKKSPFQVDNTILKQEKTLPNPVKFVLVDKAGFSEPITSGITHIYFSPEGMIEQSLIQIGNLGKTPWTLVINPLTGHADIVEKPVLLKDLQNRAE